jgi:hypothetical protein
MTRFTCNGFTVPAHHICHSRYHAKKQKHNPLSDEHKKKLSEIFKGRPGRKLTEEHKKKLRGRKLSETHKANISAARLGKKLGKRRSKNG